MVVFVNFLNGIAVSDIKDIVASAKTLDRVWQIRTITLYEAILLGDPFQFLTKWPLPCCNYFLLTSWIRRRLLLFSRTNINDKRVVAYPNKYKNHWLYWRLALQPELLSLLVMFGRQPSDNIYFNLDVIRETKKVLSRKREKIEELKQDKRNQATEKSPPPTNQKQQQSKKDDGSTVDFLKQFKRDLTKQFKDDLRKQEDTFKDHIASMMARQQEEIIKEMTKICKAKQAETG